jgi:hypothetical protein
MTSERRGRGPLPRSRVLTIIHVEVSRIFVSIRMSYRRSGTRVT